LQRNWWYSTDVRYQEGNDGMVSVFIPRIETERLLLRGPLPGDVAVWATYYDDPEFRRYLPKRNLTSVQQGERVFANIVASWEQRPANSIAWTVARKRDGQPVGWSMAGPAVGTGDVELGYAVGKPYWGQGLATEAVRAVVRYGFENQAWDRIAAAIIPGNMASRRVLEHLGFTYEDEVNYYELAGRGKFELDAEMVAYFVLRREQFVSGETHYRVLDDAS
jgi:ribosomal-protein-alanine N-acetyltransferase